MTSTPGIGGVIKRYVGDFIVKEVWLSTPLSCRELRDKIEPGKSFVYFTLMKSGLDTIEALQIISRKLKRQIRQFGFSGLKDKDAVTLQLISLRNPPLGKLLDFNHPKIKIFNFMSMEKPIKLGMHEGNFFHIAIRNVKLHSKKLLKILWETKQELQWKGGANYFGHQRFGIIRPNTHIIGEKIFRRDFKGAVMELLTSIYPLEPEEVKNARRNLEENLDFQRALTSFPYYLSYERTVLRHLSKCPNDYVNALRRLHPSILSLFARAYQSYLFNLLLSRRMQMGVYPKKAIEGDIIVHLDKNGRPLGKPWIASRTMLSYINRKIKEGKFGIFLPIFGFRTKLTKGKAGEIERELIKEQNIDLKMFYSRSIPEASSEGSYRMAFIDCSLDSVKVSCKKTTTVFLDFSLPKGSYATVILREYMKSKDILSYAGGRIKII